MAVPNSFIPDSFVPDSEEKPSFVPDSFVVDESDQDPFAGQTLSSQTIEEATQGMIEKTAMDQAIKEARAKQAQDNRSHWNPFVSLPANMGLASDLAQLPLASLFAKITGGQAPNKSFEDIYDGEEISGADIRKSMGFSRVTNPEDATGAEKAVNFISDASLDPFGAVLGAGIGKSLQGAEKASQFEKAKSLITTNSIDDIINARALAKELPIDEASKLGLTTQTLRGAQVKPLAQQGRELNQLINKTDEIEKSKKLVTEEQFFKTDKSPLQKVGVANSEKPVQGKLAADIGGTRMVFTRSIDNYFRSLGDEGVRLADMIQENRFRIASRQGQINRKIEETFEGFGEAELDNFVDAWNNKAPPINQKVQKALDAILPEHKAIGQEAVSKLPDFKLLENETFPHVFTPDRIKEILKDKDTLLKQAADLVKEGEYDDVGSALEALKDSFRKQLNVSRAGNIDYHRTTNIDGWIRDPRIALPKYFNSAIKRLEEISTYGRGASEVEKSIETISKQFPHSEKYIKDAMQAVLGNYKEMQSLKDASTGARSLQAFTKLGLATISNMGQTANTIVRTGMAPTMQALKTSLTKGGVDFAKDAGVLSSTIAEDLANGSSWTAKMLDVTQFSRVEQFNRVLAANAAKIHTDKLFTKLVKNPNSKYANRALTEIGLNPETLLSRGHLVMDDYQKAAYKIVKDTQFLTHPEDLPLFAENSIGKVMFQFKNFAYQQARFMKNYVLKEATKGNVAPLLKTIIAAQIFGEPLYDIKQLIKGNPIDENRKGVGETFGIKDKAIDRMLTNFFQVGGFGIASDFIQSAQYGKGAVAGFFFGPTGADLVDAGTDLGQLIGNTASGKDKKAVTNLRNLGKQAVSHVPVIGQPANNLIFPKKK